MRQPRFAAPLFVLCVWLLSLPALAESRINVSPNDNRDYLNFTLDNQLRVLVISDPGTDKAAASLDVDVGSNADPKERMGLAHFLEHMLFLGTEKYPQAGAYQAFIRASGGSHNAYTSYDNTNYFFDVSAENLAPALDRFSQFFIAPLFNETYVDRERNAVNSEYQSGLRDDGRRIWSTYKRLTNPEHSFSQFNVGNLETLSNDTPGALRQDLLDFYARYYSANLMTLVVLGREPVDELRHMVESRFAAVKNFDATAFRDTRPLYRPGTLPARLDIRTLDDTRELSLSFPLPPARDYWAQKPLYYLSSLIGYEGKGSLLSALKARGWANGLGASAGLDLPNASSLSVNIDLTEQGFEHYEEVTALFFSYVRLLRQSGIDPQLYAEERQLNATRFRFIEPSSPIHYVRQLARGLQDYPAEHVLDAHYRFDEFDAELIRRFLAPVRPDNMQLTRLAQDLDTDQVDPWYQTGYRITPLGDAQLSQWRRNPAGDDVLAIRSLNPYLATNLELKPLQASDDAVAGNRPRALLSQNGLELWHQQDTEFRVPKADFYFSLLSAPANADAGGAVLTTLYTRMVNDQLNETLYDAALAGLSLSLYPHMKGVSVRVSGYNERQPLLLDALLAAMVNPDLDPDRFALVRRQYAQELANERNDTPYNQTTGELYSLLLPQWSSEQKLAALESVSLAQLQRFVPRLLAQTRLRVLSHGNRGADEALTLAQRVNQVLRASAQVAEPANIDVVQLSPDDALVQTLELEHQDSAVTLYLQGQDTALGTRAAYMLLGEMLSSPFYNELRTEQQLGYIVFASAMPLLNVPGLALVVQSPVADPLMLEQKMQAFLQEITPLFSQLDTAGLEEVKASTLSRLLQKETSLSQRSGRYWQELDRGELGFNSREQLAAAIEALSIADLQRQFADLGTRRLLVRSFGKSIRDDFEVQETTRRADTAIGALKAADAFVPGA
ncbi:insulinase family protein [Marinobacterium rhizophilum]|uniref:Protease 3 n=1 Tax=Marinobacterium rhizophilum TaxID=420402 RepID=A0ABY5HQA0_9GAMM|nr:insulinase family protein [Marinobacterium rhizophilum]UTW14066.1 insulinase family protein [Marinobacterium rhizophilum]